MTVTAPLRAPFPWFGGKSRVAHLVWARFGNLQNYVEPFAGSLAVLLARQGMPGTETVNDKDAFIVNFWRAVRAAPEDVAKWADWPVSEVDLIARHKWLAALSLADTLRGDPDYYDAKVAGWWVWGICQWIGSGWCAQNNKLPEQLPHLGNGGMGINRKLPHLGDGGRASFIVNYFSAIADRLRDVRICCGDWTRVLGDSVTFRHGVTGVFLDPPYDDDEHSITYAAHSNVSAAVYEWAMANGDNPLMRIALCGYAGSFVVPDSWECVAWKAAGGYGSQGDGRGRDNAFRERIWFSPACISGRSPSLFDFIC